MGHPARWPGPAPLLAGGSTDAAIEGCHARRVCLRRGEREPISEADFIRVMRVSSIERRRLYPAKTGVEGRRSNTAQVWRHIRELHTARFGLSRSLREDEDPRLGKADPRARRSRGRR